MLFGLKAYHTISYYTQDGGGDDDDAHENLSACNHRIDELRAKLDELTQKHNEQVWHFVPFILLIVYLDSRVEQSIVSILMVCLDSRLKYSKYDDGVPG